MLELAKAVVRDGERVTKFVTVHVKGARTYLDAKKVAEAVCKSALVKSSWNGGDPNWGRIIHAVGYSAPASARSCRYPHRRKSGLPRRAPGPHADGRTARDRRRREFEIGIDLNQGNADYTMYSSDLSPEYIDFNRSRIRSGVLWKQAEGFCVSEWRKDGTTSRSARRRAFVSQQVELTEKLTSALTLIDRELFELRNEADDLDQCRACFAGHLDKIQKFTPENWTRENTSEKLERATISIDLAADEYDQAAAHFEGSRSGAIFGRASKRGRNSARSSPTGDFMTNLRNGFAFNLPILALGGLAIVVYLLK
jgi:hypothetical protein